ncbi:TonB-dependent receptor [Actimicrobium sp. CCI2.3]|uniref:TonB-dependent receptor n=1 Tax=Actimicrobium sp. CCI2.3 TaxID=3048616 RepID=UPI002AB34563|nr:TonB-dependent receptor [Actimicrobium sp. CCI2.3]MDY7575858.1 TonB-dependent receptor [Actimicrobium sp. CCI2.3]MEB0021672.1 TonB-dependent receptor [Actimicrobium sp. CCI2.3]
MTCQIIRRALPASFVLTLLACAVSSAFAADDNTDTQSESQSNTRVQVSASKVTAAMMAPSQTSLAATQPQSVINRSFIESSISPVSDYTAITAIAPSVTGGISANGPGLGEAKNGLRGFKDGEFNVTFDGIPFGDTNGATHHSTAYFPASVIGGVVVERGPGKASDFGQATFGGSVNLQSREVSERQSVSPFAAYGTWNTKLIGTRVDTGTLTDLGDARIAFNVQRLSSDGARTFSAIQGDSIMFKLEKPLGSNTLLTVNTNYNKNYYYQPDKDNGLTMAQVAQYGKNYVLSNDPTQANYYGYNRADKTTNLNYIRLQSDLGNGWAVDNNLYHYNYTNTTLAADSGNLPGVGFGSVVNANGSKLAGQMPGYVKTNEYKVTGDIFKVSKQFDAGLARTGVWLEQADTHRSTYDFNLLTMLPSYKEAAVAGVFTGINNVKYEQKSGWKSYQPFAEFEWAATPDLTITPGIKTMLTKLTIDASVNQTARLPQQISKDFHATLPFLTANYKLSPIWSTYAQYAKGMLVPDISLFQSTKADASSIEPQRSTNYQLGVVHKTDKLLFDADLYYIDFSNKFAILPGTDAQPVYYNQGGVTYKGLEGQVTYAFMNGLSLYTNGSLNRAESKATGLTVATVPNSTAALGLLYQMAGWSGSLIYKRTGTTYALDDQGYKLNPITATNLNASYTFANPGMGVKSMKLQFGIYNLFNKQDVIAVKPVNTTAGTANYGVAAAGDTFLFQPERSVMASINVLF